jgi:ABC-type multidrug transport system ATPase subunit
MSDDFALRLTNVGKTFGSKVAVNDVTLDVPRGEVWGLIGPNGAGKTTTFSMLAGYLAPTKGEVRVLGELPTDVAALRGRIGVLPQDALLPDDRVGAFLIHCGRLQGMSGAEAEKEARAKLDEVQGADWWNVRTTTLSHGMGKRVALAQALLGEPEVVLLDEPTAGLDPRIAYEVRQIVKARRGRATWIVSSHNLNELEEICDSAAIMDRGRLVSSGSMADLTQTSEEVRIEVVPPASANGEAYRGAPLPLAELRAIPFVVKVDVDTGGRHLVLHAERGKVAVETIIAQALGVLLGAQVPIRGLALGKGLEQRVMELT